MGSHSHMTRTRGRYAYLSSTGSVLSGTASDQLGIVVLDKVVVQTHVLLLCEDSIVGLDVVFLEEGFVTVDSNQCSVA